MSNISNLAIGEAVETTITGVDKIGMNVTVTKYLVEECGPRRADGSYFGQNDEDALRELLGRVYRAVDAAKGRYTIEQRTTRTFDRHAKATVDVVTTVHSVIVRRIA